MLIESDHQITDKIKHHESKIKLAESQVNWHETKKKMAEMRIEYHKAEIERLKQ